MMSKDTKNRAATINELITAVIENQYGLDPKNIRISGAFHIKQGTRLTEKSQRYRNNYLLLRVGTAFGACSIEENALSDEIAHELPGNVVYSLLQDERVPVRIAALDAYFNLVHPHENNQRATPFLLPGGTAVERAQHRDAAITSLVAITSGMRVTLIGVVNPLVKAIESVGGICLPCDLNLRKTQDGQLIEQDMYKVIHDCDMIIATGMTMSNGSFDVLLQTGRERNTPLIVYAQTGSGIAPNFLDNGVAAISAEPFPFSQFSAHDTTLYLYKRRGCPGVS